VCLKSSVLAHALCACNLLQDDGLHIAADLAEPVHESGNRSYCVRDSGLDSIEFLLAAGPAEPLRPLAAVASGGENARVMMALKMAPAAAAATAGDSAGKR
jgi:DNA repair ATPase RecN